MNPQIRTINEFPESVVAKAISEAQVVDLQKESGKNVLFSPKKSNFFDGLEGLLAEPMPLILILAAVLYFFLNQP